MTLNTKFKFYALLVTLLAPFVLAAKTNNLPNVVLVITDDQGYGDIGFHGNPVLATPNIDQLAQQSVRFTDFHVDPTCSPTRGALLTGRYAHRVGVWSTISGGNNLSADEVTMADVFKQNGYRTSLFGKWHLGSNYPYRPMDRGFDEWFGQGDGGTGTTDDWFDNDRVDDYYLHNGEWVQLSGYATDIFFDKAIEVINEDSDKPFFTYVSTYAPHSPHTIPDQKWQDKFRPHINKYTSHFFAMIERIDWNLGRLLSALEKSGKADNTLFIFMTDNGGTAGVKLYNAGMRGDKGTAYDGGHRVPFYVRWPQGNLSHNSEVNQLTAHIDVLPTLIELLGLTTKQSIQFDGQSLKSQLFDNKQPIPERVLIAENQRTFKSKRWHQTAGMLDKWRLVDNKELYNIAEDPAQSNNVIEQNPTIVTKIRDAYNNYWQQVSVNDRKPARAIIGDDKDPETLLHSSDWYLPAVPWNHAQVASGPNISGTHHVTIARDGLYRFELRRWPREANTAISEMPTFNKTVDAWDDAGGVDQLIYRKPIKALPVTQVSLNVSERKFSKPVVVNQQSVEFDVRLSAGNTEISSDMFDRIGNKLAGTYYIYVNRVGE